MRSSPHLGGALALLVLVSTPALADDTQALGDISVTATRTPLIADQEVAPVMVIGPEQLKLAQGQDVAAVLRQYAGLDTAANGGPGQPASLFLRGTNSTHTLVMIDGVKINPDNGFGSALQNIRLADVERIEIVKGPRASLYGSDAIGGVINIITRKASDGLQYGAHVGAGRYGTFDDGGDVSYGDGDSAIGASADDYHTDGFPAVAGFPSDSGNQDRTLTAFGRTKLGGVDLGFNHWQSKGYTQYVGTDANFNPAPADEDFQDATTSFDVGGHPLQDWRSNLDLSHMLDEIDQRQVDTFNFPAVPDYVHTQRNAADWQNDLSLTDSQLLTLGLYTEDEHTATESFGTLYDESHRVNALYAEDDLDFTDQRLVLAGRDTHDQEFGNHFTYNVDYGYDFSNSTRLTAGVGTSFRAPSAAERFGFDGNPGLAPETSRNYELGLRQKFGSDQLLTLSLFQDDLDDLIVFQPQPTAADPFAGENENVDRARVQGLELGYKLGFGSWAWDNQAILQNPEDLDTHTTLLRRAKHSLTSSLSWHDDLTSAGLNLLLTGPRTDVDFNTGAPTTDGGYALLGASVHRELAYGFAVLLRVDNLLDSRYQTANGYNTAGRSLFLQLEYHNR
ncbi:MAG TPA: TonB-dependent receptor [Gammaproteobacteria bacterium]|jgi:vitamin B12 transporter|nr:TonB-dependent receptor [Gammaproteobacteria bacterium]